MIDPNEKSTEGSSVTTKERPGFVSEDLGEDLVLDSRLGLYHRSERWLAVSDLHFGYEVSRRMAGGLWPLWGMQTIEERLLSLIDTWTPGQVILVGDIVDSSAAPRQAVEWLERLRQCSPELILVEGNHDRGEVKRHFDFVPEFRTGRFLFHHGHIDGRSPEHDEDCIEITGHLHPSVRFADGAGTSLRLPALTREVVRPGSREIWRLPAFSPWAGGNPSRPTNEAHPFHQWACGGHRILPVT